VTVAGIPPDLSFRHTCYACEPPFGFHRNFRSATANSGTRTAIATL
jgi:hypothetical protein